MPPRGRTPSSPPPRRRPKVAGLRQPARPAGRDTRAAVDAPETSDAGYVSGTDFADPTAPPTTDAYTTADATADTDATPDADAVVDKDGDAAAAPAHETPDTGARNAGHTLTERRTRSHRTPDTGSRNAGHGLTERRTRGQVLLVVLLLLLALVAGGAAAFFRGQAARASTGSADNLALVDTAATTEVVGQVSKAIEVVLSYDHTKLDENERLGREVITGKYADEYETTFADVRKTAPEQKLVLTTTVLLAGVTTMTENRAEVIATMDLAAVRDTTPYNSPGRVKVVAEKVDGRWKIAEMTLL